MVLTVLLCYAGGVPSADSYGALISAIKDTTDDATVAIDLFEESQRLGTRPNTFLYNTIISKLSRYDFVWPNPLVPG